MTAAAISILPSGEGTKLASLAFVDELNRRRRCWGRGRPSPRQRPRRVAGPSYRAAALLRPKLCAGSPRDASPQKPGFAVCRAGEGAGGCSSGSGSGRKRPIRALGEHESPHGVAGGAGEALVGRSAKRPRQVSPARQSLSFLSSDLLRRRYGGFVRRSDSKAVAFSEPLVVETRSRPRTPRRDIAALFYSRADEARFREEVRRERRQRVLCGGEGSDGGSAVVDEVEDEDEGVVRVGEAAGGRTERRLCWDEDGPNEVTESDGSSSSLDSDGDSSSDEEDI